VQDAQGIVADIININIAPVGPPIVPPVVEPPVEVAPEVVVVEPPVKHQKLWL